MKIMKEVVTALLVHSDKESLATLKGVLERQSVKTTRAQTCAEALELLELGPVPHLVFTDTVLPDGTWEQVLTLASNAPEFVNVIVVSALPDIRLCIETVERGPGISLLLLLRKLRWRTYCVVRWRTSISGVRHWRDCTRPWKTLTKHGGWSGRDGASERTRPGPYALTLPKWLTMGANTVTQSSQSVYVQETL